MPRVLRSSALGAPRKRGRSDDDKPAEAAPPAKKPRPAIATSVLTEMEDVLETLRESADRVFAILAMVPPDAVAKAEPEIRAWGTAAIADGKALTALAIATVNAMIRD